MTIPTEIQTIYTETQSENLDFATLEWLAFGLEAVQRHAKVLSNALSDILLAEYCP